MNPDEELAKLVWWARGVMAAKDLAARDYISRFEYLSAQRFLRFHEYLSDGSIRHLPMAWMSPK